MSESPEVSRQSDMERFHLLSTVVAYPGMETQDVRDRANSECQHDDFDPLPMIDPRGIASKLDALRRAGLVRDWTDYDGRHWEATEDGKDAWTEYEQTLERAA